MAAYCRFARSGQQKARWAEGWCRWAAQVYWAARACWIQPSNVAWWALIQPSVWRSISAGYHDVFKKSLIPITEMERLMGRKTFDETLGGLIVKPQGNPTLVPVSDKRPAIHFTNAKLDFNDLTEEQGNG